MGSRRESLTSCSQFLFTQLGGQCLGVLQCRLLSGAVALGLSRDRARAHGGIWDGLAIGPADFPWRFHKVKESPFPESLQMPTVLWLWCRAAGDIQVLMPGNEASRWPPMQVQEAQTHPGAGGTSACVGTTPSCCLQPRQRSPSESPQGIMPGTLAAISGNKFFH